MKKINLLFLGLVIIFTSAFGQFATDIATSEINRAPWGSVYRGILKTEMHASTIIRGSSTYPDESLVSFFYAEDSSTWVVIQNPYTGKIKEKRELEFQGNYSSFPAAQLVHGSLKFNITASKYLDNTDKIIFTGNMYYKQGFVHSRDVMMVGVLDINTFSIDVQALDDSAFLLGINYNGVSSSKGIGLLDYGNFAGVVGVRTHIPNCTGCNLNKKQYELITIKYDYNSNTIISTKEHNSDFLPNDVTFSNSNNSSGSVKAVISGIREGGDVLTSANYCSISNFNAKIGIQLVEYDYSTMQITDYKYHVSPSQYGPLGSPAAEEFRYFRIEQAPNGQGYYGTTHAIDPDLLLVGIQASPIKPTLLHIDNNLDIQTALRIDWVLQDQDLYDANIVKLTDDRYGVTMKTKDNFGEFDFSYGLVAFQFVPNLSILNNYRLVRHNVGENTAQYSSVATEKNFNFSIGDGLFGHTSNSSVFSRNIRYDYHNNCVDLMEVELQDICFQSIPFPMVDIVGADIGSGIEPQMYVNDIDLDLDICRNQAEFIGPNFRKKPNTEISEETKVGIEFSFYPNPARSVLNITIESLEGSSSSNISVLDLSGRIVKNETTISNQYQLDIEDLPNGSYFLRIIQNGNIFHQKWIKY